MGNLKVKKIEDAAGDYSSRYSKFVKELAKLSMKYGVAVSGGSWDVDGVKSVSYVDDSTSGDLDIKIKE